MHFIVRNNSFLVHTDRRLDTLQKTKGYKTSSHCNKKLNKVRYVNRKTSLLTIVLELKHNVKIFLLKYTDLIRKYNNKR